MFRPYKNRGGGVRNVLFSALNFPTRKDFFFFRMEIRDSCESEQRSPEFIKMGFDRDSPALDWIDAHQVSPGAL